VYEEMVQHVAGFFDGNLALRVSSRRKNPHLLSTSTTRSFNPRASTVSEAASEYRNLDLSDDDEDDKNEDDKHQLNGVVGLSGQQAASGPEEVSL
jgi:hypothetical protein